MARFFRGASSCLAAVVLLTAGGDARPTAQDDQQPTFRAGTNLVRVDAVVTDRTGVSVTDLTSDDFEITEDGKRQTIESFSLLRIHGTVAEGQDVPIDNTAFDDEEAARDDVRVFGMFLDDYHVSSRGSRVAIEQLADFVENMLAPSDMVGIMGPLTMLADLRINRDRDEILRALRAFRGRRNDLTPVNAAEESYVMKFAREVPRIRREVSLSALEALILRLGGLKEGRKTVILVTEGYGGDTPSVFGELRKLTELASRYNVAIYTFNPQVLSPRAQWTLSAPAETLNFLAEHTGGRAIFDQVETTAELRSRRGARARNNLAPALKQIVVDASANYLLGYRSPITIPDDRFHKIVVKVKRRGVEVRHRSGWWSLEPEPEPPGPDVPPVVAPKIMQLALAASAIPRDRLVRTWVGMSRGGQGKTHVTFVWEPLPPAAGNGPRDVEPARLALTAIGKDGASYFSGTVPDVSGGSPGQARTTFEVPPATAMSLRWTVEGAGGAGLDSDTLTVTAADLSSSPAIGTPRVFRVRTALDLQRVKADPNPLPIATREFSRAERLLIRVPAYGGETAPAVTAQLVSRAGRLITDLPMNGTDASGTAAQLELSLASLPPGDYAVRFAMPGDPAPAEAVVAFRIVN